MTQQSKKEVPQICGEEDRPFESTPADSALARETDVKYEMEKRKFSLGSSTLGWCIALMFACVLISLFSPENDLVNKGFAAFKLIVMTILGYIFGSSKNS